MKQSFFKNVLYLFIISGLFNLTSCSSDDDTADINGDPIGEILPPLNLCDIMHDEGDLILTNDPNRPVDYIVNCVVDVKQRKMTIEPRSEEHTSELQSRGHLVCRLLLEQK